MRLGLRRDDTPAGTPGAQEGGPSIDLTRVRESVGNLLDAGHAAIEQALSSDSEAFLRSSRQEGGE